MRGAVVAATLSAALFLAAVAAAHITPKPPFVQAGEETLVTLEVPNERPPKAIVEVVAAVPAGITIQFANAPPGWLATVDGDTATWRRGRITGGGTTGFPLRLVARVRAGTYTIRSAQRYDDGATVRWTSDLAVLPATGSAAPKQRPWEAMIAAVAGITVIVGSLVGLRMLRRRSLQEG